MRAVRVKKEKDDGQMAASSKSATTSQSKAVRESNKKLSKDSNVSSLINIFRSEWDFMIWNYPAYRMNR